MELLTNLLDQFFILLETGVKLAGEYVFTMEGMIGIFFLTFLAGFIAKIRSI